MVTINQTLESVMQLDFSTRQMLLEILQKRQIEDRRNEILLNAKQAKVDFNAGKIKPTSAVAAIKKLNAKL